MGIPKHLLRVDGESVAVAVVRRIEHVFDEVLVVGKPVLPLKPVATFVPDCLAQRSPLVGILSGLRATRNEWCIALACDMPLVHPRLVESVAGYLGPPYDAVVPVVGRHYEPLLAAYRRSSIPAIQRAIDKGHLSIQRLLQTLRVFGIPQSELQACDPRLGSFKNLNTLSDLRDILITPPRHVGSSALRTLEGFCSAGQALRPSDALVPPEEMGDSPFTGGSRPNTIPGPHALPLDSLRTGRTLSGYSNSRP